MVNPDAMDTAITLPLPAVDLLGQQLDLDPRAYPFEIPRVAPADRAGQAERVRADLAARGLLDGADPTPEVADALYLLSKPDVAVAVAGLLDVRGGHTLAARVAATGEVAVLGVLDGSELRMEFRYPDELASVSSALLPDERAGVASGEAGASADQVLRRPKHRLGHFVVSGRHARLPSLAWFDTDAGRYAMGATGKGGGLFCEPADRARLATLLDEFLARA